MGRFLQTDPMGYTDSMNLYQAFNMNPFNFTDPMGEIKAKLMTWGAPISATLKRCWACQSGVHPNIYTGGRQEAERRSQGHPSGGEAGTALIAKA